MFQKIARIKYKWLIEWLVSAILLLLITFIWYRNNHWSVLMGDDIAAVNEFRTLGLRYNLINSADVALGKIRPISKIMLYVAYRICNLNYNNYYMMTRVLLSLTSFIIVRLLRRMDITFFKAISIAGLIIICPFSMYGVWQYIGICEIWSLLCCMLCGYYIWRILYETNVVMIRRQVWLVTLWFTLLIYNAERFMYLLAVFVLVIFTHKLLNIKDKLIQSFKICIPIIIRFVFLKAIGSDTLATGRGSIESEFLTLIAYALRGFVNMMGFSLGEIWHGGFQLTQIPNFILALSAVRIFLCLGVLYDVIKKLIYKWEKKYFEIVVWYLFSFTSLFSYALVGAVSGEDRFLWVSYAFYLIAIGRYLTGLDYMELLNRKKAYRLFKYIVPIMCTLLLIYSNYFYFRNKVYVHYRYSQEIAETAIEKIVNLADYATVENIVCVGMKNDYMWVFQNQIFFKLYINDNIDTYYFDSFDELNAQRDGLSKRTMVAYPASDYETPIATDVVWLE